MRKIKLAIVAIITILLISTVSMASKPSNINIAFQGKALDIPKSYGYSFIDNKNRTMIPLRAISELLGHTVLWDTRTQTATIDGYTKVTIGKNSVQTKDGHILMDTQAILKNGRTYVPLRFIIEALGYKIDYNRPNELNGYNHMIDILKEVKIEPLVLNEEDIQKSIMSLKSSYPEGKRWTNDNYYKWDAGIYSGGYGCYGFAFILSDEAFGQLPARKHTDFNSIRIGDIVRINKNTHSVVVTHIENNIVTLAEGNFNSSIHWGRTMSSEELIGKADYIITRYPEK